jgi:hypothetical protein
MIKIEKYKYRGKRAFIIASGPSAKGMDLAWLKDEITICVNQSYRLLDFDPTYICISDEGLWPFVKEKYAKMKTKVIACFADTQRFIDDYSGDNMVVMFKNLGWDRSENKSYNFNLPRGLFTPKNVVPGVAIPFAHWVGFSPVYLVGCDCSNAGYAYKNGFRQKEQFFNDYTMQYYKLISELRSGTVIYNVTVGGNLNYFPRVDFDSLSRSLLVIGYYTGNGDYAKRAVHMKKSVEEIGLRCHTEFIQGSENPNPLLRWALDANICPRFIKKMRRRFPNKDLFCVDVDAEMLNRPKLFLDHPRDYDFGAVFINNFYHRFKQLCGGSLYFAATKNADNLLDRWIEVQAWRNKELEDGIYKFPYVFSQDQGTLQAVLPTIPNLKWVELPLEYGYIIPTTTGKDIVPPIEQPVIRHLQASRTNRRGEKKCVVMSSSQPITQGNRTRKRRR